MGRFFLLKRQSPYTIPTLFCKLLIYSTLLWAHNQTYQQNAQYIILNGGGSFQNETQYYVIDLRFSIFVFFKKNTHYVYGFYGYRGYVSDGVATE